MARSGLSLPHDPHPHLVLLSAPDSDALDYAARLLDAAGLPYARFSEPDLGDIETSLCTAPLDRGALPHSLRKFLRGLPLWDAAVRV